MELEDITRGEHNYNVYNALSSRKKLTGTKETANTLLNFANKYFAELNVARQILKSAAPESRDTLDIRWRFSDVNENITNIEKLMGDYDRIFSEAKQVYLKFSDDHERRDELGVSYKSCLNKIVRSLETEFSQVMNSAKSYHIKYF